MSSLQIENLSRAVEIGQSPEGRIASETSVLREMERNGMEIPKGEAPQGALTGPDTQTFLGMLRQSVDQVNQHQHQADHAVKEMVAGRNKNIHETLLAVERADASLKLMMQVRNKILDAYREIMRMQI